MRFRIVGMKNGKKEAKNNFEAFGP